MVWGAAFAVVDASNNKRNACARVYSIAAILSNNPFLVALRTFVTQIPCKHWRSAEIAARGASAWQGLRALVGPSRGLSWLISVPDHSAAIDSEFSLLSTLNSPSIVCINCNNGLCHLRHVLAWLSDTLGANGLINFSGARFASHSAALVSITQTVKSKHHLSRQQVSITQKLNK